MKLGLYGGGFKPFHAGHFSKLQLALDQNDKVFLLFGIKKTKYSKRTGKLSSTWWKHQRSFDRENTGDSRRYAQEMQEAIFKIYEEELENLYPEKLEVMDVSGTPIGSINRVLDAYATMSLTGNVMPLEISGQTWSGIILNDLDEINVYAGPDEIATQYVGQMRKRAEKGNPVGQKLIELIDEGVITFTPEYHPDTPTELTQIRGTDVRDFVATGDEEGLRRNLPNLTGDPAEDNRIKDKIIDVLKTDFIPPDMDPEWEIAESRSRSISSSMLMRAAARFSRERLLSEQVEEVQSVPPGRESHIYNLYEDLAMPLSDIIEIGRLALEGKLENFQEKVDGQNVTFTVRDGVLRFFVKLSLVTDRDLERNRQKIQSGHGMDLALINEKYADKPGVATAFSMAYEAIEPVALQFQDSLFKNGDLVVVSGLITSVNPNTIIYDADTLRFITPVSLTGEPVDQTAYEQFLQQARAATTDAFSMDTVPTAKLVEDLETDDTEIESLMSHLETVVGDVGLSVGSATVGDYVGARVEKILREKYKFIPEELAGDVANRFMTGRGAIANRLKRLVTPDEYQQFRQLDSTKADVVAEAIVPLEEVIQSLGVMVIDKLDLALTASNQDELLRFVREVRDQFAQGRVIADEKTLEKIRVALTRLEANEKLFTKATEGIVFTFNGNTYKLTGLFTPINRLRGFFEYGSATLPQMYSDDMNEDIIRAARRFLQEGGDVFKDSTGVPLTVEIELTNVEPTLKDFSSKLLEPLGLGDYGTLGSTGKASKSGDLDLAFPVPKDVYDDRDRLKLHKKEIKSKLISMGALDATVTASNIYVLYPISGETQAGEFVQVDLMPTPCVADTCWLMSGVGDEGIKGTYRNQLFNLIARERGLEGNPREKMTIAYPGGIQRKMLPKHDKRGNPIDPSDPRSKRKWENVGPKISDPASILGMLGVPAAPEDVETFEELVDVMLSDLDLSGYLPKFEDYMLRHLSSEKTAAAAQRAVDHVNAAIAGRQDEILAEVNLRRAIRAIMEADETEEEEEVTVVDVPADDAEEDGEQTDDSSSTQQSKKCNFNADKGKKVTYSSDLETLFPQIYTVRDNFTSSKNTTGAEEAIVINENLICLLKDYAIERHTMTNNATYITIKKSNDVYVLEEDQALGYFLGYLEPESIKNTWRQNKQTEKAIKATIAPPKTKVEIKPKKSLPNVPFFHKGGNAPYDIGSGEEKYDVKQLKTTRPRGSSNHVKTIAKLGDAASALFIQTAPIISLFQRVAIAARKNKSLAFSEEGEPLLAKVDFKSLPELEKNREEVVKILKWLYYYLFIMQLSASKDEGKGFVGKSDSGAMTGAFVKELAEGKLFTTNITANQEIKPPDGSFDDYKGLVKKTLAWQKDPPGELETDSSTVKIKATLPEPAGDTIEGNVKAGYFFDEILLRMRSEIDKGNIDADALSNLGPSFDAYEKAVTFLAELYTPLAKLKAEVDKEGNPFNTFIEPLKSKYAGFFGPEAGKNGYYRINTDDLEVNSTTQGWRAVLRVK